MPRNAKTHLINFGMKQKNILMYVLFFFLVRRDTSSPMETRNIEKKALLGNFSWR